MRTSLLYGLCTLLFLSITLFTPLQSQEADTKAMEERVDSLRRISKKAPVVPFNDTIFHIYTRIGSYTPAERAAKVTQKIKDLNDDFTFHPDSLLVIPMENVMDISYGENIIMSITPTDTKYFNLSQEEIAYFYRDAIADSIRQYREDTGIWNILKQVGLVLLIVIVLYFLLKYLLRFFRLISQKVMAQKGKLIKGISIKSYNILDEEKATNVVLFIVKIIKYLAIILLFYLALPVIFSIFPETRDVASKLIGYVTSPLIKIWKSILKHIPNIITIIVIVILFRYLIKGIKYFANEIEIGRLKINGFYPDWAMPTYNIVRTLLYAFMFIIIFPYLPGSDSKIFQGVSVFIGVIISLGSTSLIGNVVSGLVLTYMRPFMVGDFIKIGDITGTIVEKTPFVTRIRTPKNENITIPNSNIMSVYTVNYTTSTRKNGLIVYISVGVGYDIPWQQVHQLLIEAALKTEHILKKPEPFVLQRAFNDFYVEYQLNAYTKEDKKLSRIYSDLHAHVQDVFNEARIELLSPHYHAQRDGNEITIPKEYQSKNPETPTT